MLMHRKTCLIPTLHVHFSFPASSVPGSKLFDNMVYQKEFLEKVALKKIYRWQKMHAKLPSRQRVDCLLCVGDSY